MFETERKKIKVMFETEKKKKKKKVMFETERRPPSPSARD